MQLSVIIPVYNAEDTIGEQLEALSKQEWNQPWEVVVVDNNSTDRSMEIVKGYKDKIPFLKIIEASQKQGKSYARNKGVEECNGEYIAFCDADDVVGDGWLPSIGEALMNHDFVACKWEWTKLNDPDILYKRSKGQSKGLMDFPIVNFLPHAGGGSIGIKKRLHFEVGGFDERLPYLQDTDYCWKVQLSGSELVFVPDAVIHIRDRSDRLGMFKQSMNWAEYNVYLYKKYSDRGMPEFTLKQGLLSLYRLLLTTRYLFFKQKRERWIRNFGAQIGRIKGAIKYKVFVL